VIKSLSDEISGRVFCYSHVKNKDELNFLNLKLYIMKAFFCFLLFVIGLNANAQRQVFNYAVLNGDTVRNDFYVYTKNVAPDSTHLFITQYLDPNFSYDSLTVQLFNEPILKREISYKGSDVYNNGKTRYEDFGTVYYTPKGKVYFWTTMIGEDIFILRVDFEKLNWYFNITPLND
jgi:hypothetical protein